MAVPVHGELGLGKLHLYSTLNKIEHFYVRVHINRGHFFLLLLKFSLSFQFKVFKKVIIVDIDFSKGHNLKLYPFGSTLLADSISF